MVSFKPSSSFFTKANKVFKDQEARLKKLLPFVEVQHIGSTSVPGSITKGDIDIQVRVKEEDFAKAQEVLAKIYKPNKGNPPTKTYASFKDNTTALPLGIQLTVVGSEEDKFILFREILFKNNKTLTAYNELKNKFQGKSMKEYRKEKGKFIENVLKQAEI